MYEKECKNAFLVLILLFLFLFSSVFRTDYFVEET